MAGPSDLHISLFHSSLAFSTLSCELQTLGSPKLQSSISSPEGFQGLCLSSAPWRWNSAQALSRGNHSVHLICFPCFRDQCPLLSDAQCLKNYCFTYYIVHLLVISGGRVNPAPITTSQPEGEAISWHISLMWASLLFGTSRAPGTFCPFPGPTQDGGALVPLSGDNNKI